jgi:hypothetical protein
MSGIRRFQLDRITPDTRPVAILVTDLIVMLDSVMTVGMTKTVCEPCHILIEEPIAELTT